LQIFLLEQFFAFFAFFVVAIFCIEGHIFLKTHFIEEKMFLKNTFFR